MFATDRDLLIYEPNLFRDIGWLSQRLLKQSGTIAGTTLTLAGADLAALGVTAGHVAIVGGTAYEVVARLGATTLTVSRVRDDAGGAVLPPAPGTAETEITTFRPQIAIVHRQILRMLGIEPQDPPEAGAPGESSITNPTALTRAEALGALHMIWSAAASLQPGGSAAAARAELYRARFAEERQRAAARIDLDGDGLPDATRRLNALQFVRV